MSPTDELQDLLVHADDPRPPDPDEPLRFSRLKLFSKSAAHFIGQPSFETTTMRIGTGADEMILGIGDVLRYPSRRAGKDWEKFQTDHPGAIILNAREYALAEGMTKSVRANPLAMRMLDGVKRETMLWEVQGRACRGTPDVRGNGFITDLKTSETADPRFFPFKVRRYAYHAQLAWYTDGAVLAKLGEAKEQYIVAVESSPPFVTTVFRLTPKMDAGRRLYRLWFEQMLNCAAADAWPGYSQSVVDCELPGEGFELDDAGAEAA